MGSHIKMKEKKSSLFRLPANSLVGRAKDCRAKYGEGVDIVVKAVLLDLFETLSDCGKAQGPIFVTEFVVNVEGRPKFTVSKMFFIFKQQVWILYKIHR